MSDDKGIRKECAVVFKEITVKLNTIRNNDLVHIHDDIKDIRTWIRTSALVVLSAILCVLGKVLFF